ncbi:MAG TPA: hypothetical protein VEA40_07390 [Ramlibacter sp.]|nr:hypothetical protein [Ramlibacter sp.]
MRDRGTFGVFICTSQFVVLAKNQARINRQPDQPLVVIDHPLGGIKADLVEARVAQAVPLVLAEIRKSAGGSRED